MNKAVFGGTAVCALFLIIGTYTMPTDLLMWFANTSIGYTIVRSVLIVLLLAVMCTTPPRAAWLRLVMASAAVLLIGWGVHLLFAYSLPLLDVIVFIQAGVAFGLESIELDEDAIIDRIPSLRDPLVAASTSTTPTPHVRPMLQSIGRTLYLFSHKLQPKSRSLWLEFQLPN